MAKFILISAIVVLAAIIKEGSALKCWRCSSEGSQFGFCADPFDPMLIPNERQRRWTYVECYVSNITFGTPPKAVCKKVKHIVNNRKVVSRSCSFEEFDAPPNQCSTDSFFLGMEIESCQTCSTDGCNGAEMESFEPVASGSDLESFPPSKKYVAVKSIMYSESGATSIDRKIAILIYSSLFLLFKV